MRIQVLYFAAAREAAGRSAEAVDVPAGSTVADVTPLLAGRGPGLARALRDARFAVGERFVPPSSPLREGDRLAVLPPVSGG